MKIALVTPYDYPYPGGVTEHVRHLDREFRALGHETHIIAPSSKSADALAANVIKVGGRASFKLKGFPIQGVFAVVDVNRELTWVGKSLWTRAIDRHVIESTSDGLTRLLLEESFAGLFAPLMISSRCLSQQHEIWLGGIKSAIETGALKTLHR